jgi:hypothetical protein
MCLFTRFPSCTFVSFVVEKINDHEGHEVSRRNKLVRNHSSYFGRVRVADQRRRSQMALAFLFLRRQDVAQERLRSLDLSRSSFLEALSSALMCF